MASVPLLSLVSKDPSELKAALVEMSRTEELEDKSLLRSILLRFRYDVWSHLMKTYSLLL